MSIIIFDTETSGLPKKNNDFSEVKMLEIGYLKLNLDLTILEEKRYIVNVDIDIPNIITQLTGLTNKITKNEGYNISKILNSFLVDIKDADILIAHNNRFDLGILRQEFDNTNQLYLFDKYIYKKINLNSIDIFKNFIEKKNIKNYKLQTIYNYYNNEEFNQTHRALDDCYMLHNCLNNIKLNNNFNPYTFYLNKKYNFKKYPSSSLVEIYKFDKSYVLNFLKKLPISRKIKFFL